MNKINVGDTVIVITNYRSWIAENINNAVKIDAEVTKVTNKYITVKLPWTGWEKRKFRKPEGSASKGFYYEELLGSGINSYCRMYICEEDIDKQLDYENLKVQMYNAIHTNLSYDALLKIKEIIDTDNSK